MAREVYAIDLDETLVPFDEPFLNWHNQEFGTNFYPENVTHNYAQCFDATIDWSERLDMFVATEIQHEHPPLPYSQEVLRRLARVGRLVVLTARPETHRGYSEQWLSEHFYGVFDEIHMRPVEVGHGRFLKGEVCAAIGATVLLDDSIEHIDSALDLDIRGIVFGDYPKQASLISDRHERAKDWYQAEAILL